MVVTRTKLEDRSEAPLLAVFVASVVSFALYTAVKASYESTIFSIRVWERNLIYLAPVVFVAALRYVVAGRLRPVSLLIALALTGYLLATTPYHAYEHFYSDAPGLAILQWLNRTWAFTNTDLKRLLFGLLALSALIAIASTVGRRSSRRPVYIASLALIGLAAVAAIAWNLTGEIAAANSSNSFSKTIVALPKPPNWIDRSTGRQRTVFVGEQISNSNFFWSTEFWNQSIRDLWTTDGSTPGLGPSFSPNFASADGEVDAPRLSDRWGVAPSDITLAGRVADKAGDLTLYELAQPIRIKSFISGVYPDGWMGAQSSFVRFGRTGDPPGRLIVSLSRQAACGTIAPARLKIRVSQIRINKDSQPVPGRLQSVRSVVVRSSPCERVVVSLPAQPPFRADVTGTGFFKPADGRSLSVQIGYAFKPKR